MASINMTANFSNQSSVEQNAGCSTNVNLSVKITEILTFSIILLFNLVGNTLIVTIVRKRPELRNTINYFIVNMAVSDFLYPLTSLPVHIAKAATSSSQWRISGTAGLIFCKLYMFTEHVSLAVSIQSLVWIAVDRFVAVVFPMKVHFISSRFRSLAISSTWIVAILTRSLDLYIFELVEIADGVSICAPYVHTSPLLLRNYKIASVALFRVMPFVIMTILYSVITTTLLRQNKALPGTEVHQRTRRKQSAVWMSFCIIALFYICLFPVILNFIVFEYNIALLSCFSYKMLWMFTFIALYLSSTVNPIICMAFVKNYRRGLKEIFSCCLDKRMSARNLSASRNTEEINLKEIKIISMLRDSRDNPAFSEM